MATQLLMAKDPAEAIGSKTASAAFVAGGTEVNRLGSDIAMKAESLISLKKCSGLADIKEENGFLTIGSMCTFQQLIESEAVPAYLKEAARFMASRTKRNMATIGGNIAAARSDSYLIPALHAAGAVISFCCKDSECAKAAIADYLDEQESYRDALIISVTVPADIKMVSKRYANTAQSHAVLTMSAALRDGGLHMAGAVKNVGILHFCDLEKAFMEDPDISEETIVEMVRTCTGLHTADDMFGSDDYKRYLIGVTAFGLHRKLMGKEV